MNPLFILGDPPTADQMERRRRAAGKQGDAGLEAFMMCPVPLLDLAVGAVATAIDESRRGGERAAASEVTGAAARDWSATRVGEAYVAKVRNQGRELVAEEVAALEDYVRWQGTLVDGAGAMVVGTGALVSDLKNSLGTALGLRHGA